MKNNFKKITPAEFEQKINKMFSKSDDNDKYDLPTRLKTQMHDKNNEFEPIEIIVDYTEELCSKVINYGKDGYLIDGFAGKYNICVDSMCNWISKTASNINQGMYKPDFHSAVKISISACIHYWNNRLMDEISAENWDAVAVIKSILNGLMRTTPDQLTKGLYNNLHSDTAQDIYDQKENKTLEVFEENLVGTSA